MSSIFDDILENKRVFDPQDLFKGYKAEVKEDIPLSENIVELNKIFKKLEENPNAEISMEEVKLVDKQNEENLQEAKQVLREISDIKNSITEFVNNSGDGFVLDLTNKSRLKQYSNAVFGENKNQITFEDYITLLELKKLLDYKDASDMLFEEYK